MAKRQTTREQLHRIRARIAESQCESKQFERALLPLEEIRQHVRDFIRAKADLFAPPIGLLAFGRQDQHFIVDDYPSMPPPPHELVNLFEATLAALIPDQLERVLVEHLERGAGDRPRVPAQERATRLEALAAELRELEIDEERIVRELAAEGVDVIRRADVVNLDVVLDLHRAA